MTEKNIKLMLIGNVESIMQILKKGNDVEIRKTANGISITEVKKKVIVR